MRVPKNLLLKTKLFAFGAAAVLLLLCGCSDAYEKPLIIWTDRPEIVSYVELFNVQEEHVKAVVVYKERLANSLPPAKDEQRPDVVIGSWLKNSHIKKNFSPLNALFSEKDVDPRSLYDSLVEYGTANGRQYLLPVSFNLPVMIFSLRNAELIPDDYMLSPDEIRDAAAKFNVKNARGFYTNMGYAPSWEPEFLYTVAKLNGAHFKEKGSAFVWDSDSLAKTVSYINDWTSHVNGSTTTEQDFAFKYLYTPKYRQVDSGRCLFAYSNSSRLFSISYEQLGSIDFRWIQKDMQIPVEDAIVMAGIYRHSYNGMAAKRFLLWLLNTETQKTLLSRSAAMHLNTASFGIAGGFSSIREVNERLFPAYYLNLIGNLPPETALQAPQSFPSRWTSLKERIILPYLAEATKTDSKKTVQPIDARISTWLKQFD